jgi:hypothetical protein
MSLLQGLIEGQKMREFQENLALRQEEAKLHAQLFASRQKWYDTQAKLIEHNIAKGQALSQKLRDVFTASSAGTAEPPQGEPQDAAPPAPTYEGGQPGVAPTPEQTAFVQKFTPPADEAQQRLDFAKKYGPQSDQTPMQAFSRQYGPQATPQAETPPAPPLEPTGSTPDVTLPPEQGTAPAATLEALRALEPWRPRHVRGPLPHNGSVPRQVPAIRTMMRCCGTWPRRILPTNVPMSDYAYGAMPIR